MKELIKPLKTVQCKIKKQLTFLVREKKDYETEPRSNYFDQGKSQDVCKCTTHMCGHHYFIGSKRNINYAEHKLVLNYIIKQER